MLAPPNKTLPRPTSKELEAEADRWLARYRERPEDSVYHYRLDANGRPTFPIIARHVDLIGASLWNGVKTTKKARCGCLTRECKHHNNLVNARPVGDGRWMTTLRTYQPATHGYPVSEPVAAEDETFERFEIEFEAVLDRLSGKWTAPQIEEIPHPFVHIAGWQRFLPGLVKG
jgi:hypothetical protein